MLMVLCSNCEMAAKHPKNNPPHPHPVYLTCPSTLIYICTPPTLPQRLRKNRRAQSIHSSAAEQGHADDDYDAKCAADYDSVQNALISPWRADGLFEEKGHLPEAAKQSCEEMTTVTPPSVPRPRAARPITVSLSETINPQYVL